MKRVCFLIIMLSASTQGAGTELRRRHHRNKDLEDAESGSSKVLKIQAMNRPPSTPKELNDMESGKRKSSHMLKMTASDDLIPRENNVDRDLLGHYGYICLAIVLLAILMQAFGLSMMHNGA